jgi:O-phosphoseryl-tRNA synthetase
VADGEEVTKAVLKPLGFNQFRFLQKKATSKYYAPGTEYEGYVFHTGLNQWMEIANYGLYSPIALARYDLEHPVLNVGIGVERVAMALCGETDIRALVHPQFYLNSPLSDDDIAVMVGVDREPQSEDGISIRDAITSTALQHASVPTPCEILAFAGDISGKKVKVYLYENDKDAKLLGPAALNRIYVYRGNILGIPRTGLEHVALITETRENGISVGLSYLDVIASLAAARVEDAVQLGQKDVNVRVKMVSHPSEINLKISDVARRYITDNKKNIEITGPVFIGIRAEITS